MFASFFSISVNANELLAFSAPKEGVIQDISANVLIEAYRKIGYDVKVKRFPNARSLVLSNNGDVDGEVSRIKGINKKHNNLIRIPITVNFLEGYAFAKKASILVTNWESLKEYNLLCVRGIKFVEFNLAKRNINCHHVTLFSQAVKMLQLGRYDVAIFPKISGISAIKKEKVKDVQAVGKPLIKIALYHYLHKKHKNIANAITTVLTEMEKKGRIKEIRDEYIRKHNY
jgi:polar amino acid transport system substrate-binding protein